jgi:hypothetical protein
MGVLALKEPLVMQLSVDAETRHTCWQKGSSTRLGGGYGLSSISNPWG